MKQIWTDDFGNIAEIQEDMRMAYQGGPVAPHFRVVAAAAYDGNYIYHVSCFDNYEDARADLRKLSCGTFKRNGETA